MTLCHLNLAIPIAVRFRLSLYTVYPSSLSLKFLTGLHSANKHVIAEKPTSFLYKKTITETHLFM